MRTIEKKQTAASSIAIRRPEAGETVHSPNEKKDRRISDDNRFLLKIPGPGERIVWPELTPYEKRHVIAKLQETFRNGKYDINIADGSESSLQFFLNIVGSPEDGIDPFYLFEVASRGKPAGVCRHGNCARVGLLAQIGATSKHVRLVTGYSPDRKTRHMWFEYRLDERAPWLTGDATAANGNLGLEPEKLGKTYDELYPRDRQFHDVFFTPTH